MLNLDVAPGRGGKGSMSINGRSFELITLESRTYFNGSAAFWKRYGGGAAATLFENRWLETPTNGQFKSFAQLTNIRKIFRFLVHPGRDNLTKMGLSTVNGQKAIGVQNGTGGTLYVATVGKPYPIEIEKPGSEGGHVTFSDFNQPVSIHPPAGAINMSQLNSK